MNCLYCGDPVERKFCDRTHKNRYHAKKSYNKRKDDPSFKSHKKEIMKNWYLKNKVKHLINVKIWQNERKNKGTVSKGIEQTS
jgi:hypothetical protein